MPRQLVVGHQLGVEEAGKAVVRHIGVEHPPGVGCLIDGIGDGTVEVRVGADVDFRVPVHPSLLSISLLAAVA